MWEIKRIDMGEYKEMSCTWWVIMVMQIMENNAVSESQISRFKHRLGWVNFGANAKKAALTGHDRARVKIRPQHKCDSAFLLIQHFVLTEAFVEE